MTKDIELTIPEYTTEIMGMIFKFVNMKTICSEDDSNDVYNEKIYYVDSILSWDKFTIYNKLNPEIEVEITEKFYDWFLDTHWSDFDNGLEEVATELINNRTR